MNISLSLCRRLKLSELVPKVPVYSSGSGMPYYKTFTLLLNFQVTYNVRILSHVSILGYIDASGGGFNLMLRRWASKKTAGSTKNGRDSKPKNLGVKKFGGEVSKDDHSSKHNLLDNLFYLLYSFNVSGITRYLS